MCWKCVDPKAKTPELLEFLRQSVEDDGWAFQTALGTELCASIAYTVGLTALGLPELVLTGTDPLPACALLDELAQEATRARLRAGDRMLRPDDGSMVEIVRVAQAGSRLRSAAALYGGAVRGLQVVRVDAAGRWPWQAKAALEAQPMLGVRVALPLCRAS